MSARCILTGRIYRQPDGRYTWEYTDTTTCMLHHGEDSQYSPGECIRDMARYIDKREAEHYDI